MEDTVGEISSCNSHPQNVLQALAHLEPCENKTRESEAEGRDSFAFINITFFLIHVKPSLVTNLWLTIMRRNVPNCTEVGT